MDKVAVFVFGILAALGMQWLFSTGRPSAKMNKNAPPAQRVIACMASNLNAAGDAILQATDLANGEFSSTLARLLTGDTAFPLGSDCFKGMSKEAIAKVRGNPDYKRMQRVVEREVFDINRTMITGY